MRRIVLQADIISSLRIYGNSVIRICEVTSGAVSGWKNGAKPKPDKIKIIADYFGVTVEYLLNDNVDIEENAKATETPIKSDDLSDDLIRLAFFKGEEEPTPEMIQEIKDYVEFIKQRRKKN